VRAVAGAFDDINRSIDRTNEDDDDDDDD